jgi:hypothetical protein
MVAAYKRVFQFKITLLDTSPEVWRRILVPETYTFYDLHVAIQDAMGWTDSHLHIFKVKRDHKANGKDMWHVGIPDPEFDDQTDKAGWETCISDHFSLYQKRIYYCYDFGDCWEHIIEAEELMDREVGTKYPKCIEGKNACPPEDVGGTHGFEGFKECMTDPSHEEHEDFKMWYVGDFDPTKFNPEDVKFRKPSITLRALFR